VSDLNRAYLGDLFLMGEADASYGEADDAEDDKKQTEADLRWLQIS
jgi:hypothetical protein